MNWISVKDRLPKSDKNKENILFKADIGLIDFVVGRYFNDRFEFWSEKWGAWQEGDNVTHWCEFTGPEGK